MFLGLGSRSRLQPSEQYATSLRKYFLPRIGRTSGAFLCALVAIVAATIAPSLVRAETPGGLPAGLYGAVEELVEARPGHAFAGLCEEINQNEHDGQWCASVLAMGELQADVRYGPISSSPALTPLYFATFVKTETGWLVTANTATFATGIEVPAGLRAAIRSLVESGGNPYAGLCGEINVANHPGQHCVSAVSISGKKADVTIRQAPAGPVYQESFINDGGTWTRFAEQPPVVTEALRAAIRSHVQERGYEYGGLCEEIRVAGDAIVWCASIESLTETKAAVQIGRATSAKRFSATFEKSGSRWSVRSSKVPQNVPAELLDAIEDEIEDKGHRYVGLCEDVSLGRSEGNWCATISKLTLDEARVSARPVRSSDAFQFDLERKRSRWVVVSSNVPFAIPDSLRSVVQSTVVGRGYGFSGLCEELSLLPEAGRWCASIRLGGHDSALVTLKSSKQPQYSATFARVGANWSVRSLDLPLNISAAFRLAIAQGVNAAGYNYAGLCEEIDSRVSLGKACASILSHGNVAAVVRYGLVQTNEAKVMNLVFNGGSWTILANSGVTPPTPTPATTQPPATPTPSPVVTPAPQAPAPSPTSPPAPRPEVDPPVPAPTQPPVVPTPTVQLDVPGALRDAIRRHIEGQGLAYAGLCEEIVEIEHLGKQCASVTPLNDSESLVRYGRVLSAQHDEVIFVRDGEVWALLDSDSEGRSYAPFVLGAIGLGLLGMISFRLLAARDE